METAEGSKQTNTVVAFHLQSDASDGQRRIDAFVDAAYDHYQARQRPNLRTCPSSMTSTVKISLMTCDGLEPCARLQPEHSLVAPKNAMLTDCGQQSALRQRGSCHVQHEPVSAVMRRLS